MKVSISFLLVALLPVLTDAQFGGFPLLPSPPRLFFGGFRPLFPTRSRRPPRRPPPFIFQRPNVFTQAPTGGFTQQQNFVGSSQSSARPSNAPSTRAVNFNPPSQSRRPQQRPQQQQQQQQQRPQQQRPQHQRPQQQHNSQNNGFGAPKPQSIISRSPQGPPRQPQQQTRPAQQQQQQSRPVQQQQQQSRPVQQQQPRPVQQQQPRPVQQQQQFLKDPFFHRPVEFLNDNSIIGMLPPPFRPDSPQTGAGFRPRPAPPPRPSSPSNTPRRPQQSTRPSPPSQGSLVSQVHHVQPSFEQIQLPPKKVSQELQFEFVPLTRPPQPQRPRVPQRVPQRVPPNVPQTPRPTQAPVVASVPLDPFDLQFNPVNPINSNSLEDLVINKVPAVNAGVLPLAHEKPTQLELFPPFNTRRSG